MSMIESEAIAEHTDRVWHTTWDKTGKYLATCGGDKMIKIWGQSRKGNKEDSEWICLATLDDAQKRTIRSCEFSPCGKYIASVSFDALCVIWELQDDTGPLMEWDLVAQLEGHENEVKSCSWNASGDLLATCSRDKSVFIWECMGSNDFECLTVLHGHTQDVKFVKWHPTKPLLFSASYDDTIKVWADDDSDWYNVDTLTGHTSTVWGLAFEETSEGLRMASCSDDGSIIIWKHYDDGEEFGKWRSVCRLSGLHQEMTIYSIDWSRLHGGIVTGCADNNIRIFRESEGSHSSSDEPSFELESVNTKAHVGDVNCVRWNPKNPGILVSGSDDNLVKVWHYKNENCI